ncbi:MAG TPA: phosphate-starvation-inducible PsiE family protein [Nitrospira sp.]|nr:phosphate-starvation-inducible PsiE family protein [Nitrospira sp.]
MSPLQTVRQFDGELLWQRLSHLDFLEMWGTGMKGVLSLVMLTLLAALTGGALKTLWEVRLLIDYSVEVVLRQVIVNTLMLLALVEVFKTTVTYFREGRVKATFIVDTILVVMLTELISQWFKGGDWHPLTVLLGILVTLSVVRVMAVRWSPTIGTRSHDTGPADL